MSWMGVDLQDELRAERKRREATRGGQMLEAFKKMLADDDKMDEQVLAQIFDKGVLKQYDIRQFDEGRIYHLSEIKKLCVQYRLRFLDASLFRNEIPYEAISEIKKIQRQQEVELSGFKILAPAPMFNLERKDRDPLLFLSLGNDNFYLIHKWGGDLHPLRKLLVFPFRNFKTLLLTVMSFAFAIAMMVPESVMATDGGSGVVRGILFFYIFFAFSALTILYGFSRMKDFNSSLWNSKYTD